MIDVGTAGESAEARGGRRDIGAKPDVTSPNVPLCGSDVEHFGEARRVPWKTVQDNWRRRVLAVILGLYRTFRKKDE